MGYCLNTLSSLALEGGALPPGDDIASLPKDVQKLYWLLVPRARLPNTLSEAAKGNCGYYQYLTAPRVNKAMWQRWPNTYRLLTDTSMR